MDNKKILIFLVLGMFMISFGSAALINNVESYYKLDESSGSVLDSHGSNNGVNNGAIPNVAGKLNTAYDFESGDVDYINMGDVLDFNMLTNEFSMSVWIKLESKTSSNVIISKQMSSSPWDGYAITYDSSGRLEFSTDATGSITVRKTISLNTGQWYHIGVTLDASGTASGVSMYIDSVLQTGVVIADDSLSSSTVTSQNFKIGSRGVGNINPFDGVIDELGIWTTELSAAEMLSLYNSGNALAYPFTTGANPEVVLNAPENNYFSTTNAVDFNVTVTDDLQIENVTLYIDGIANETNLSGFNGTYIFSKSLTEGPHNWSILAYDNESRSTQSATRNLEVDTFTPNITIYEPVGLIEYLQVGNNLTLNSTIEDQNLDTCWFEYNNTEVLTNSSYNPVSHPGDFFWEFPTEYSNVTRLTIDTGVYASVPSSCSRQGNLSVYQTTDGAFDYAWYCLNEFDSYVLIDGLTTHWQQTPTVTAMIKRPLNCSESIEDFEYVEGENSLCVHAIDTGGLHSENVTSWDFEFLETNRTFNAVALQTATETFQLNGIKQSGTTAVSAVLHYNGNEYAALKTGSGNDVILTNVVGIPTYLTGSINFYWTVTYTNSTGTYEFNTTSSTQEVFALSLEECFAPSVDGLTLNFTTYDSTNLTALDSTFEATFQFYAQGGSGSMIVEYLFSDLNENRSNYMFCLNSSGQNVTLDAFVSYDATDFDRREYILDDAIIGNFTQSIPLFLTETELTDIVTIIVQDQSYDPIAGALVNVQTWNVGTNTYSTTGMLTTSSSGQGIIDLELYTTWYRSVVSVAGEIVQVTDVQKLSGTSWIITVALEEDNPYDLFGDILYGLTFDNSTNITSFTWVDASGYTQEGCMVVKNNTNLGPVTIFDSCVESVSGTIDYLISGDGDYDVYGIIFLEGYDASQIVDTLNTRLGTPAITETVSPYGKVITFLMIGVAGAIGVAAGSIILGSFLLVAVLFAALKFGFLNITSGFIWGIISILLIAIFIQKRKRG